MVSDLFPFIHSGVSRATGSGGGGAAAAQVGGVPAEDPEQLGGGLGGGALPGLHRPRPLAPQHPEQEEVRGAAGRFRGR